MNQTPAPTTEADAPFVTEDSQAEDGCPIARVRAPHPTQGGGDRQWWPNSLNLNDRISRRFLEDLAAFADAFARAWCKLTHRDVGPKVRCLAADVPTEDVIWQDSLPEAPATTLAEADIAAPKQQLAASGVTVAQLISAGRAAASSFRGTDKRGGATGARIRLEPQRSWEVQVHMLAGMP